MKRLVVDASVAVKWVLDEEGSAEAALLAKLPLIAPDLLVVECANALWSKAREGELTFEEVAARVEAFEQPGFALVPSTKLISEAARLALKLGHPVYDCLYLALALREESRVITADRRFFGAVAGDELLRGMVQLLI
jgi:predicted nucleic acid-binding protein